MYIPIEQNFFLGGVILGLTIGMIVTIIVFEYLKN